MQNTERRTAMTDEEKKAREEYLKTEIARITYNDGQEEPLTWGGLHDLLRKSRLLEIDELSAESVNEEELKIIKQCISTILDFDIGIKESFPDDPKRETRMREIFKNALQIIIDYLGDGAPTEENPQADKITQFLRGELEYMLAPRPRGYNELLKISSTGERGIQYREIEGEVRIAFPDRLAFEEHKIRQACEFTLIDKNFHGARNNLITRVTIPIDEVMEVLGRPNNHENKKKFKRQLEKSILPNIKDAHIDAKIRSAKKEGDNDIWIQTNIGQACGIINDHIYFQFTEDYARYINTGIVKPYHEKLMRLGSRQFPLPYYVGQKMSDQYFYYANQNRKKKTNNILRIKTLLDHCKEIIDYEYIMETDPTHWKPKIKAKYERALNEIREKGLFKWEYCGPALREIPQAEIDGTDFYKWSELYITFQLIPEEPAEQAQRLENRRKRIEKAIERKALEDDRITAEAAKERKRRRRKKTSKKKGESSCPEQRVPLKP